MTPAGVSVVVCSHNSAERLPETLRHMAAQKVPAGIEWEVVVVDNASSDSTRQVAESFAGQLAPGQLRVVDESTPGLSHARLRGLSAARYEFLSFVDDDNWVAEDWVATVFEFFSSTPDAGAAGGMGEPVFEGGVAPKWFSKFCGAYAAGPQYKSAADITDEQTSLLWGAGLEIRKSVFEQLLRSGFAFMATGRSGSALSSGEDVELCLAVRATGWRLHYTPKLRYKHFIPCSRLDWSYLRRLFRGAGQSAVFSRLLRMATDHRLPAGRLALERMWTFQVLHALRALARIVVRCPRSLGNPAEGLLERLQVDALLGTVKTLLALRGRYRSLFDANRQRYPRAVSLRNERPPARE